MQDDYADVSVPMCSCNSLGSLWHTSATTTEECTGLIRAALLGCWPGDRVLRDRHLHAGRGAHAQGGCARERKDEQLEDGRHM